MRASIVAIGTATCAFATLFARESRACGGCFHKPPPTQTIADVTDERMLLSITGGSTTLYDQLRYDGDPSEFAWVLPIHGQVTVGLSADVVFDSIDALTATEIIAPNLNCSSSSSAFSGGCSASSSSSLSAGDYGNSVTVTKQGNVGPYETVQLHSTDPKALTAWLDSNGYQIPPDATPTIDAYVSEGFDFLAMKLLPGQGIHAMRPVRVTMPGTSLTLPLRMAAVGTGATVGITLWVLADGRYQPQNFPSFVIEDTSLVWDWATSSSNYTTLRAQNEHAFDGSGWEIESSIDVARYAIANVILAGGGTVNSYSASATSSQTPESPASEDYEAFGDPKSDGSDGGTPYTTAEAAREEDLAALLGEGYSGTIRVTRMRADLSHGAMAKDLVLEASADQSERSNVHEPDKMLNAPACPSSACSAAVGTTSGGLGLFVAALLLALARLVRRLVLPSGDDRHA
ncbi:MAG TPA: DUF2330 domain-containing protein [Polyangiaceae bacterium]